MEGEMEEALLPVAVAEHKEKKRVAVAAVASTWDWEAFAEGLKKVCCIAVPMVVASVSQYLPRMASMIMVGHLSELSLSGAAVATSLTNVTGFSLLFGMAGALETLCGQAYGAEQYQKLGMYTFCSFVSLVLVCVPVAILWIFVDKLLIFIGQDPLISLEAGKYSVWLIVALVPYGILQSLMRYMQSQSMILPMILSSMLSLSFHLPVCWALVFKLQLGNAGAALAIGLSYWANVILLLLYVIYSPACEKTRILFSKEALMSLWEFFSIAIPSAVMVCLEWWSFELLVLFCGLLPNPQLETSVLSICLSIASLHYYIPYAIGAAASIRVSNELGAGNPQAAQSAVWVALVLALGEVIIASTALFCYRHILGRAFSEEMEVVSYMEVITPILCFTLTVDTFKEVLSGVARGSGWQKIGAYINLGAYYVIGIPAAVVLGFVLQLRGKGLWIGLSAGTTVQCLLFFLITSVTNWQKQAIKARERIFKEQLLDEKGSEI